MKKIAFLIVALGTSSLNIYAMNTIEPVQEVFFKAVNNNDPEGVKAAIENGADINMIDPKTGATALYQILSKVDQYKSSNLKWTLPSIGAAITALLSFMSFGTSAVGANEIINAIRAGKKTLPPEEGGGEVTILSAISVVTIVAAIGMSSLIATGLLGRIANRMRTRLEKALKIAQILLRNPKIKIDDMTDKLRRQIMSKLPPKSQPYLRVRELKVTIKPK